MRAYAANRRLIEPMAACLGFDGTNDLVTGSTVPFTGNTPFTVVTRFRARKDTGANQRIMSIGGSTVATGATLYVRWTGRLCECSGRMQGSVSSVFARIYPMRWYDLALTHAGGNTASRVYLNGDHVGDNGVITPAFSSQVPLLGRVSGATPYWFDGWLARPAVYSRQLDEEELRDRWRNRGVDSTGLELYWPLDDGAGGTAHEEVNDTDDAITSASWDTAHVEMSARGLISAQRNYVGVQRAYV